MKSLFHFNCVICGARPREVPIGDFAWPPDDRRVEDLLDALRWIMPRAARTRYAHELKGGLKAALVSIADRLGPAAVELYEIRSPTISFTRECPLCNSDAGPRPYDRYFSPWLTWHLVYCARNNYT